MELSPSQASVALLNVQHLTDSGVFTLRTMRVAQFSPFLFASAAIR